MTDHRMIRRDGYYVADNAVILGNVSIGNESSVWYGCVLRGDIASITIGETTNIQDGCVLHCDPGKDLVIGHRVTVGHMAMIHAKDVGDECLIGIGAILLGGARIGAGSIIGAGALIREDQVIPPRSVVVGLPGKIIGQVTDEQLKSNIDRAKRYHQFAIQHLTH